MFGLRVARKLVLCTVALGMVAALGAALAPAPTPLAARAGAQEEPTEAPVVVREPLDQVGEIIPRPNSGVPPQNPGDRGGVLQFLILGLMVAFGVIAVLSIRRSGRKQRGAVQPEG